MTPLSLLFTMPHKLEMWLVLGYVLAATGAARAIELLARWHFARARAYHQRGFEYDADADHYRCPGGERLTLHQYQADRRLAVYRAPKHACNACAMKSACTPHDEGRHLYRSMSEWAETDVGRFHLGVSLLIFGVSGLFALAALVHWLDQPGTGLLAAVTALVMMSFVRALARLRPWRRNASRSPTMTAQPEAPA
jgi:hypothetical protein